MKAIVLSAGYGTRLGDLTRECPKPMLRLAGRPLLELILCQLHAHGFNQIAVNLHYRPDLIRDYFGDGSRWGVQLTYAFEPVLLGTAGALKNLQAFLRDEQPFLVHYGDIVTDQDFTALLKFHIEHRALSTLLVHTRRGSNSIVQRDPQGRITAFIERPTDPGHLLTPEPWVNSSILIAQPELLDLIPAQSPCDLPRDVFPQLVASGRFFAFPLTGYRCAIDGPDRLEEARHALAAGRCRIPSPACAPDTDPSRISPPGPGTPPLRDST